tara:strand:+ start:342 stop:470 length:129 start_codon:yes stop_codon:yes gene_type:complete
MEHSFRNNGKVDFHSHWIIDAITNGDIEDAVKLLEEIKLSVK